jgi:hypothetical protein
MLPVNVPVEHVDESVDHARTIELKVGLNCAEIKPTSGDAN